MRLYICFLLIFSAALVFILIGFKDGSEKYYNNKNIVAEDGNTLFYNSPIATKDLENNLYISYLTSEGGIKVNKYNEYMELLKIYNIHNYKDFFRKTSGGDKADDHAAPAISYNRKSGDIIVASSYHGTDLNIFKYSLEMDEFVESRIKKGNYTYPRIVEVEGETLIFLRKMHKIDGQWVGDLIVTSSKDNFQNEQVVITSEINQVVYASRPFLYGKNIYLTWSNHFFDKGYSKDWYILEWNLNSKKGELIDISKFSEGYIGNRPTAIAVKNDRVLVGSSYFIVEEYGKKQLNFNRINKLKILSVDLVNKKVSVVFEDEVYSPYYGVDMFIDDDLNFVYFDRGDIYYNGELRVCEDSENKMYPVIYDNMLFYSKVNQKYRIRDFNNTLMYCQFICEPVKH